VRFHVGHLRDFERDAKAFEAAHLIDLVRSNSALVSEAPPQSACGNFAGWGLVGVN